MDDQTFQKYVALVYEHSGIVLGETKKELVQARGARRMRFLGVSDYRLYYQYITQDATGQELTYLLDAISTHVTSFFREKESFDFISITVKKWYQQDQRRFRLWSAGCSTGEEPFSLAMTLLESFREEKFPDVKILATDISRQALETAQKGVYEKKKLTPFLKEEKYFTPFGQNNLRASDELKKIIVFKCMNLKDKKYPFLGPLDAVFCRNVMIYFDERGRSEIIGRLLRLLKPGGYLFVGHSESLLGMNNGFKYVRPSIYQRQVE